MYVCVFVIYIYIHIYLYATPKHKLKLGEKRFCSHAIGLRQCAWEWNVDHATLLSHDDLCDEIAVKLCTHQPMS